jgi:hypothetical protein
VLIAGSTHLLISILTVQPFRLEECSDHSATRVERGSFGKGAMKVSVFLMPLAVTCAPGEF